MKLKKIGYLALISSALCNINMAIAQSCPAPPTYDVVLYFDNSGSISTSEFNSAQASVAEIAKSVLSVPGNRLAVLNWGCTGDAINKDGCRLDLATGDSIPGGWSTNPDDFSYAGANNPDNKVCRSFGPAGLADGCQRTLSTTISSDYAQDALRVLDDALYAQGQGGGTNSFDNAPELPSEPIQRLMIIHLTDAFGSGTSTIKNVPLGDTGGDYYYSNYMKYNRNAIIVSVGIRSGSGNYSSVRNQLGAFASKGGSGIYYDVEHQNASSSIEDDMGAPRHAVTVEGGFDSASILEATDLAFEDTTPPCVILTKRSTGGTGNFNFVEGTNGLPANLSISTVSENPAAATGFYLSSTGANTSIREIVSPGWDLASITCTDSNNSNVPVVADLIVGRLTIPASEARPAEKLTCTFTNQQKSADLSVTKTANSDSYLPGDAAVYTIVVANAGPFAADNAVITDDWTASPGLDCSAGPIRCTASGSVGTQCPASIAPADLQSGLAIPALPNGGAVTIVLECKVTATGL